MATQMSGESFVSRMRRPLYVLSMANGKTGTFGNETRWSKAARTAHARAMAQIDVLVLERASALTGLNLIDLPRDPAAGPDKESQP